MRVREEITKLQELLKSDTDKVTPIVPQKKKGQTQSGVSGGARSSSVAKGSTSKRSRTASGNFGGSANKKKKTSHKNGELL